MPKKLSKAEVDELNQLMVEMCQADGKVKCDECSTPNWTVYHEPGKHIKQTGEQLDALGKKAKAGDFVVENSRKRYG